MPEEFVPAAGRAWATRFYDAAIAVFAREKLLRGGIVGEVGKSGVSPRVLELGCGTGSLSIALAESLKNASITGVDLDPVALGIARGKPGAANVEWLEGNVLDDPPSPGTWDCVVISLVLHHLKPADQPVALSQALAALKPGGTFHVVDFAPPENRVAKLGWPFLQRLDGKANTDPMGNGELPGMIDDAGFEGRTLVQRYSTVFGTHEQYRATRA